VSDFCLCGILLHLSLENILILLTCYKVIPNKIRILYKISLLTEIYK